MDVSLIISAQKPSKQNLKIVTKSTKIARRLGKTSFFSKGHYEISFTVLLFFDYLPFNILLETLDQI